MLAKWQSSVDLALKWEPHNLAPARYKRVVSAPSSPIAFSPSPLEPSSLTYQPHSEMAFLPTPALHLQRKPLHHRQTAICIATSHSPATPPSEAKTFTRRVILAALASAAGSLVAAEISTAEENSKLQYNVVKKGKGPAPEVGDLVGIRFKGTYNGVVFDNLFEETKPYFYRVGSGAILKVSFFTFILQCA